MPGVLIVEALAQTGGILALKAMGSEKRIAYFTGIDNCKFRRPVVPGDQLRLEITVIAHKGPVWKMHGEALVDGAIAAKGDVTATIPDGIEPGGEGEGEEEGK
jgi:3-hydroxymyristoyl/3-hydroxydecanoyl-(acyl carrier protein) dehydratase